MVGFALGPITTRILYIIDRLFHHYLDSNYFRKNINCCHYGHLMFVEKLLVDDFYYVNQPVSNINTDEFTNKQNVLNKKIIGIILSVISSVSMSYH